MSETDIVLEYEFQGTGFVEYSQSTHEIVVTFYKEHINIHSVGRFDKNDTRTSDRFFHQINYNYQEVIAVEYPLVESKLSVRLFMSEQIILFRISDSDSEYFNNFMSLRIPQRNFLDDYQIVEKIRQGAQGTVFKCLSSIDNQIYAVKFLDSNSHLTHREVSILQLLAQNPHKNISTMKEYFIDGKQTMIVFPYINGGTLYQYMLDKRENKKQIDFKKTFKQILKGLQHIHDLGLIHRDIKMDNIMVEYGPFENVKIIDFGFAVYKDQINLKEEKCGTIGYMAPEIINEEEYDEKCDIFSLSQVFHTMITGSPMYNKREDYAEIAFITKYNLFQIDRRRIQQRKIIDLLDHMIKGKNERYNTQQCLNHEFLKNKPVALRQSIVVCQG